MAASSTVDRLDAQAQAQAGGSPVSSNPTPHGAHERGQMAADTLRVLRAHCEWLTSIRGRRKALIWVSEGFDYNVSNVLGQPYAEKMLREFPKVLDEAARANVAIYALSPFALNAVGDDLLHAATGSGEVAAPSVFDSILGRGSAFPDEEPSTGTESFLTDRASAVGSLRTLAELTGGFTVVNTNDLTAGLNRIVEDTSRHYLLGFTPSSDGAPDELRRIEVRVRRDGVRVRTRYGYAPTDKEEASPERAGSPSSEASLVTEALTRPLPLTGLALRVAASPLGESDDKAVVAVVVHTDVTTFAFEEKEGRLHDDVVVWVGALKHSGELVDSQISRAQLRVPVGLRTRLRRDGFRAMSVLRVPAGSYQLRVVVREANGERTGSVMTELEVPRREDGLLRGVALSSKLESRIPTAGRADDWAVLPGRLTATRQFRRTDELIAYVEMLGSPPKDGRLVMSVRDSDGSSRMRFDEVLSDSAEDSAMIVSRSFSLSELTRGSYRLEIRALAGGDEVASRDVDFAIR